METDLIHISWWPWFWSLSSSTAGPRVTGCEFLFQIILTVVCPSITWTGSFPASRSTRFSFGITFVLLAFTVGITFVVGSSCCSSIKSSTCLINVLIQSPCITICYQRLQTLDILNGWPQCWYLQYRKYISNSQQENIFRTIQWKISQTILHCQKHATLIWGLEVRQCEQQ